MSTLNDFAIEENADRSRRLSIVTKRTAVNCAIGVSLIVLGFFALTLYVYIRPHGSVAVVEEETINFSHDSLTDLESRCEEELCVTKECVSVAARMLRLMDDTANPCDDFYQYACGNYRKQFSVRSGEFVYNAEVEARDNLVVYIKKVFDEANLDRINGKENTKSASFSKAEILHASCSADDKREQNSSAQLNDFLLESGITWPIFDNDSVPDVGTWTHEVQEMAKYGYDTLFDFEIVPGSNPGHVKVKVDCDSMTMLPEETYLNPTVEENENLLNFYKDVMHVMMHLLGYKRADAKKVVEEVIHLETEIAKALETPAVDFFSNEHEDQIKGIWTSLLHKNSEDLTVVVICRKNIEAAMKVLNEAPKMSSLNLVGWRSVVYMTQFMSAKFQGLFNHYVDRILDEPAIPESLWRECADFMRREMGSVMAKALLDKHYITDEQIEEVKHRYEETKSSFKKLFNIVPWLTNDSRKAFAKKIDRMTLHIHPDHEDLDELDAFYSDLHINEDDSFLKNAMNLRAFSMSKNFAQLDGFNDDTSLGTQSFYDYEDNEVHLGYGAFMSPIMKQGHGFPSYLKHGQNVILAKEIGHALDSYGVRFDANKTKVSIYDLKPVDQKGKFFDFITCLQEQPQGSTELINEDIGDLASLFITAAAAAFENSQDHDTEHPNELPGISLTKLQIYFVQSAQNFCELVEKHDMKVENTKRSGKERLHMAISNMVSFKPAFHCDDGTPMNPTHKCNLLLV